MEEWEWRMEAAAKLLSHFLMSKSIRNWLHIVFINSSSNDTPFKLQFNFAIFEIFAIEEFLICRT